MRKYTFLSLAAAALLFTACSTDDNPGGGSEEAGASKYLAVNIMNVGNAPTSRAVAGYEDGTQNESVISKVRFYFFHADGSPYILKKTTQDNMTDGDNANWLETTNPDNAGKDEDKTVEQITKSVLVINGTTASAPASIIAVINPQSLTDGGTVLGSGAINLNTLRQTIKDSKFTTLKGDSITDFVMSNSVYANAGASVCSSLVSGHVKESADDALSDPVDIYVERVVAKVQASVNEDSLKLGDGHNWETTKYGIKVGTYGNNTPIYAVVDGWGVADEDGQAEIEKQIDVNWTGANLGIEPWTTSDYHRSFWSKSVPFTAGTGGNQPVNHKFTDYTANFGMSLYTLPNTPSDVKDFANAYDNYLTKFLVATHLRYEDAQGNWHNAEICKYKGVSYLGVENLKKQVARDYSKYYTKTGADTYESLDSADVTFTTSQIESSTTTLKDYQVIPTLANTSKQYYINKGSSTHPDWQPVTAATVNTELAEAPAEVRTDGMAYYYVPIRHLASDPTKVGYYGVVRNHFYKISLRRIAGFGTPVYDKNKIIDPTIPSDANTYLAARINVLQWRVVSQEVDLDKTQK